MIHRYTRFLLGIALFLFGGIGIAHAQDASTAETVTAEAMPDGYFLSNAYPNPFNPSTTLRFAVAEAQPVTVSLHDMLGRQVGVLFQGRPDAGQFVQVRVDGSRLSTGLYVVRLLGEEFSTTRTITLVR
ncbi:MAG: T9SS type A sorting domain-containing protein [Bacteroidota bacterium]